jgi:hypothetical protein
VFRLRRVIAAVKGVRVVREDLKARLPTRSPPPPAPTTPKERLADAKDDNPRRDGENNTDYAKRLADLSGNPTKWKTVRRRLYDKS